MKNEISSLEMYYLVKELKVLEGSKIDRIYHQKNTPKELMVGCHITGRGKAILKVLLPGVIFLDDTKDVSDSPTGFGMMLRKYLEGTRIKNIEQKDFERVITITIDAKNGQDTSTYHLIIELFSKGNMIFCDDKMQILNILEEQSWKDRTLKRKEIYIYPKAKINTLKCSEEEFTSQLKSSGKESVVKDLAITFNLGGKYSEEICTLAKIDKNRETKSLTEKEFKDIYKNLLMLLHEETEANSVDGEIFPFILEASKGRDMAKYQNFSEAIRQNYDTIKHLESKKETGKNVEKIQNIIEEQMKLLEECQAGYDENQAKGELIYERYQEVSIILNTVKDARTKYSWNAIRQKLNDNPEFKKIIKDIDEKSSSIIIEIDKTK